MSSDRFLDVTCKKCGNTHRYSMDVRRAMVLSLATYNPQVKKRTFRRLLTCPENGEDFEVVFVLTETPQTEIQTVKILGVVKKVDEEEENENE